MLTGCSGTAVAPTNTPSASSPAATDTPTPTPTPTPLPASATELAELLRTQIPSITQILTITEDNDPNDLIGRPNGYIDAVIIYDSNVACTEPGASCGATLEIWSDRATATARSEYIQGILTESPALGTEYNFLSGVALLRVDGDIKPSVAATYEAALRSTTE